MKETIKKIISKNDYYIGFEGYNEIIFYYIKNNIKYEFNIWSAYFNNILDFLYYLKFKKNIELHSDLVLHHCMIDAWQDNSWKIDDKKEIIEDLILFINYSEKQTNYKTSFTYFYDSIDFFINLCFDLIDFINSSEEYNLFIVEE